MTTEEKDAEVDDNSENRSTPEQNPEATETAEPVEDSIESLRAERDD